MKDYRKNIPNKFSETLTTFSDTIRFIPNTNLSTFKKQFEYVRDQIDQSILDIICFTDTELKSIKKMRDCIAHGSPVRTLKERDITHESKDPCPEDMALSVGPLKGGLKCKLIERF